MRIFFLLISLLFSAYAVGGGVVDFLVFGDTASERVHALESDHAESLPGLLGESARRLLPLDTGNEWRGGTIAFTLKVDPVAPNYFTLRLSGDDAASSRLFLVVEGLMIGYLHLGDIDLLEPGATEPQSPGRFFYRTTPLPESLTRGKKEIRCEVRSTGPIWAYGTTLERFQKPMTEPTRGLYRVYAHTEPAFVPPAGEKQGSAPADTIRSSPGPEILENAQERVNREIATRLNDRRPLNQMQMMFLAEAWHVQWTGAYHNDTVIRRVVESLDAFGLAWRKNPKLVQNDPATPNPDWFGAGPVGATLHWLARPLAAHLDGRVAGAGDSITRRKLLAQLFVASREWNSRSRRLYTNQSMIKDLYGIYYANRGLQVVAPAQAWSEEKARRYLYEAVGLQPWLGSDLPGGGSAKTVGEHYLQLTAKGLTKELGYVGSYGEVVDWVTKIYEATRPAFDEAGDPRLRDQLVRITLARAPFRHAAQDAEGYRAMRMETFVGWRDTKYPGLVTYGQKPARDASALDAAYATRDPRLLGYAQQMIADHQFFASLAGTMAENNSLRITHGLLYAPEAYRTIIALPPSPHRMPMSAGAPDFVFTDEENGVIALKHGDEILYASLYWRARHAVNFLAAVHHLTPAFERQAIVREEIRYTPSGHTYRRPGAVVFGFGNGGTHLKYPGGSLPVSAHAGEALPIAAIPEGIPYKIGQESVFAGKGDFYVLHYGDYLIAMNTTADRSFDFEVPSAFASARDLVRPDSSPPGPGKRAVAARSTIILRRAE
ncbi:MAG: hypothetical protein K0R17_3176 [Rariglobus sp.]|jgi:hypothetical protein|nr:hypothetical protein [Rariglobus sp.]